MIDLKNLPAAEAERLAYMEGFTGTAELFARIADLEAQVEHLEEKLENAEDGLRRCAYHDEYREFFFDCFERLAGHYPAPSVTSDYDKSVIFAAIEKGEGGEE